MNSFKGHKTVIPVWPATRQIATPALRCSTDPTRFRTRLCSFAAPVGPGPKTINGDFSNNFGAYGFNTELPLSGNVN